MTKERTAELRRDEGSELGAEHRNEMSVGHGGAPAETVSAERAGTTAKADGATTEAARIDRVGTDHDTEVTGGTPTEGTGGSWAQAPAADDARHPYPIILVHGIAAYDRSIHSSDNWGRIPQELEAEGYRVFFGNTDGWGSVEGNGLELAMTISEVLAETEADQVIVVAHSKGGLDVRAALLHHGIASKVRGVATFSSPHDGLRFCTALARSRFLLPHVVSHLVNGWSRLHGDRNPDSIQALRDLTKDGARELAALELSPADVPGLARVPFLSFGFRSAQRRYPRNHVAAVVRHLDGENDGLVPLGSTAHGSHQVIVADGRIEHDDCVDKFGRDYELVTEGGEAYSSPVELILDVVADLTYGTRP